MEYQDFYKTLGVSRDATQDEIKRAYRKLARKYHPDVSKESNAEQRFKEVGEAYQVLSDSEKRAAYDQLGTGWQAGQEFRPPPGWNAGGAQFDFSDFFDNIFGGHSTQQRPFETTEHSTKIAISLEEAYQGTSRIVAERGRMGRKLNVKIPKGVIQGQKIRLSTGMGRDLYMEIEFQPHRLYRAEKRDIYLTLPITPWEAALGCTVAVPTLGGKVTMKIPAGSESGQKMRLKGRGFPGNPPGDHYVVLQLVTPKANSSAAKAFYKKMAEELPYDPRADISG
ncbi:cytochrome C biogenesis protein [Candidatus Thiomargarita nelsonii]|uniref:Cytochrome C biogenesis protein n=1 Tax=Candidatus Thiomargarita nelsonii TaxID=1003181 RepID=A0A0A6PJK1_9GAMM|nr:cytochrome C biogenesis protein [Candidatus Thiomargarita nelsonii]